jgi:hypothetical protein
VAGSHNLSNKIHQTCLGELMLNSSQASLKISSLRALISIFNLSQISSNLWVQTLTQAISISFKTSIKGKSSSFKSLLSFSDNSQTCLS